MVSKNSRVNRKGKSSTREYAIHSHMKARCYNVKDKRFKSYGGRGILICDRWLGKDGYDNFLSDMGNPPTKDHTIDRLDVNGNYEPSNCRWATRQEQNWNTTRTILVEYKGETKNLKEWAEVLNLSLRRVSLRSLRTRDPEKLFYPGRRKGGPVPKNLNNQNK